MSFSKSVLPHWLIEKTLVMSLQSKIQLST